MLLLLFKENLIYISHSGTAYNGFYAKEIEIAAATAAATATGKKHGI